MTECWVWDGARHSAGYGVIQVEGKQYLAHRVVWEEEYGSIPKGVFVCHSCDNPPCTRPSHLFLGTHADNMADMVAKGRQHKGYLVGIHHNTTKTHCVHGHPFDAENTYTKPTGKRQCRVCHRDEMRKAYYARKKINA